MGLLGGKKSKQIVGLDIGSSSIKAVELKATKAGYELVSFGMESLAPDTVVDGAIMDAPQVANAISKIFDAERIKTKNVATSVSGHPVMCKRMPLPLMTEEDLYDRIPSEASQHIPYDIADVNLSYQLLESMDSQMDVLLVAVKKDKILNHTNVLAQAGKTPTIVDIDAFALQNCFEVNYEPDSAQTVALLNIGASVMNINIVRGGIPLFTRDVSVGGNQYTDALQKELDLSFEDAERLKKGDTLPSVTDDQRQQILRSVSDILTLEIQKTFDFFRATASGENIQRIVAAGGTARVKAVLQLRVNTIEQLQRDRTGGQELLDMVANTVSRTENLWLTQMTRKGNTLAMDGASASINAVANFITALKRSGYFQKVEILESKQDDKNQAVQTFVFQITAEIAPPQPAQARPATTQALTAAKTPAGKG